MATNASAEFHLRFVKEKHKEVVTSLNDLINTLVSENLGAKKAKADEALSKLEDLKASIAKEDAPPWLSTLINGITYFKRDSWKQAQLIDQLIKTIHSVRSHKWVFDNPEETAFDFDSIFERYKKESRLPELFDEIIRVLESIQQSGDVDSITMMNALSKVISTLKSNKKGSYFSINGAWSFLISFLKNYMWAELSQIPTLGPALEALERAVKETNEEMFTLHCKVQTEMDKVVEEEIKPLSQKSSFGFVSYDKQGSQLPQTKHFLAVDENV